MLRSSRFVRVIALASVLVVALAMGPFGAQAAPTFRVAFVSCFAVDTAEWLQALVAGMKVYAKQDGIEFKVVEAVDTSEFEPKIRAVAQAGYDLIITSYDTHAPATIAVAKDFPKVKFASLQGEIKNIGQYKNIQEFKLNRLETAYLAGAVAGATTKTGRVGIVGGADVGGINEIIAAWQQGLRRTNPKIEDYVAYANTFSDPTKGKELGLMLIRKGCDVIGAAAGGTGVGAAQAAADMKTHFVAWDVHYADILGGLELGSAVNFFDRMFRAYIADVRAGNYKPGVVTEYGISRSACDFEFGPDSPVNAATRSKIATIKSEIAGGKVEISPVPLHK